MSGAQEHDTGNLRTLSVAKASLPNPSPEQEGEREGDRRVLVSRELFEQRPYD